MTRKNFTLDDSGFTIKASAAVATSAAGSVIATLGEGFVEGNMVIDVTGLDIDGNNEIYDIVLQLSPDALFGTAANIREKVALSLSASGVKRTDCDADDIIGRYIVPFNNLHAGTLYPYARIYTVVAGAGVGVGITYSARLCKR